MGSALNIYIDNTIFNSGIEDPNVHQLQKRQSVTIRVMDLEPNITYTVRVQAENQDEEEKLSDWAYRHGVRTRGMREFIH